MANSNADEFTLYAISDIPLGRVPRRRVGGPKPDAAPKTPKTVRGAPDPIAHVSRPPASDAPANGRTVSRVNIATIATSDLPRDRLDLQGVATSDEMQELKSSIAAHGQMQPIELYHDANGALQLKKGWRRLTALRSLHAGTGQDRFDTALARIDHSSADRLRHYIDMVEDNTLRVDLTFAEMAQLAIEAAKDPLIEDKDPGDLVARLYASSHRTKRSYIRAFVRLLDLLGGDLQFPKAVGRDLGLGLIKVLKDNPGIVAPLKRELAACRDAHGQSTVLRAALARRRPIAPDGREHSTRRMHEFQVGSARVSLRRGECRINDGTDFTCVPRDRLERAVAAFQAALRRAPDVTGR